MQDAKFDIEEIKKAMQDVPFGNSHFQNVTFLAQETPERQYRNVLLQMNQKLDALQKCQFNRRRAEIDIQEIEEKLSTATGHAKRRLEIDLEEKKWELSNEIKYIEDAIIEVNSFYQVFKGLPKITREQFEATEKDYWTKRLVKDAQLSIAASGAMDTGVAESIRLLGMNPIGVQEELRLINNAQRQMALEHLTTTGIKDAKDKEANG